MNEIMGYKITGKPNYALFAVLLLILTASAFLLIWQLGGFGSGTGIIPMGAPAISDGVRRQIDGAYVARGKENAPLYAVVIDNNISARPLSGLAKASLVYEAPVEGGITRLLAIFDAGRDIREIGPIRSARPYFIDLAGEFGALFTHVGGSPAAMERLKAGAAGIVNLDLYYTGSFYWRDSKRSAPHNVYTSSKFLADAAEVHKLGVPLYDSWQFKSDAALEYRPEKNEITVAAVQSEYTVRWVYNKAHNSYFRYHGEKLERGKDGGIVSAKNVVVLKTDIEIIDAITRREIRTTGEGEATVFRGGAATVARWKKADVGSRLKFYDESGAEIAFNAGPTWIEIVPK